MQRHASLVIWNNSLLGYQDYFKGCLYLGFHIHSMYLWWKIDKVEVYGDSIGELLALMAMVVLGKPVNNSDGSEMRGDPTMLKGLLMEELKGRSWSFKCTTVSLRPCSKIYISNFFKANNL